MGANTDASSGAEDSDDLDETENRPTHDLGANPFYAIHNEAVANDHSVEDTDTWDENTKGLGALEASIYFQFRLLKAEQAQGILDTDEIERFAEAGASRNPENQDVPILPGDDLEPNLIAGIPETEQSLPQLGKAKTPPARRRKFSASFGELSTGVLIGVVATWSLLALDLV
ncbi:hypothetical protein RhiJN_23711 [Ceratobasidium sp. AG-Ba]|nr:hypothetical protein RhiJN_23711 [Ceratobasidium sp. AG-Ba]